MPRFIPPKMIICKDKDHLWIIPAIETVTKRKYIIKLQNEAINLINGNAVE